MAVCVSRTRTGSRQKLLRASLAKLWCRESRFPKPNLTSSLCRPYSFSGWKPVPQNFSREIILASFVPLLLPQACSMNRWFSYYLPRSLSSKLFASGRNNVDSGIRSTTRIHFCHIPVSHSPLGLLCCELRYPDGEQRLESSNRCSRTFLCCMLPSSAASSDTTASRQWPAHRRRHSHQVNLGDSSWLWERFGSGRRLQEEASGGSASVLCGFLALSSVVAAQPCFVVRWT